MARRVLNDISNSIEETHTPQYTRDAERIIDLTAKLQQNDLFREAKKIEVGPEDGMFGFWTHGSAGADADEDPSESEDSGLFCTPDIFVAGITAPTTPPSCLRRRPKKKSRSRIFDENGNVSDIFRMDNPFPIVQRLDFGDCESPEDKKPSTKKASKEQSVVESGSTGKEIIQKIDKKHASGKEPSTIDIGNVMKHQMSEKHTEKSIATDATKETLTVLQTPEHLENVRRQYRNTCTLDSPIDHMDDNAERTSDWTIRRRGKIKKNGRMKQKPAKVHSMIKLCVLQRMFAA